MRLVSATLTQAAQAGAPATPRGHLFFGRVGDLAGESAAAMSGRFLLLFGGFLGGTTYNRVFVLDTSTGVWATFSGALPGPRRAAAACALPDGRCLLVGGQTGSGSAPVTATYLASLDAAGVPTVVSRAAATAARFDHRVSAHPSTGVVHLVGGKSSTVPAYSSGVISYDPATNVWSSCANYPSAVARHAQVTLPDGRVFVAGGETSSIKFLNTANLYDPVANTWSACANMPAMVSGASAFVLPDGRVAVYGGAIGVGTPAYGSLMVYDPATNTWVQGWLRDSSLLIRSLSTHRGGAFLAPGGGMLTVGEMGVAGAVSSASTYSVCAYIVAPDNAALALE